MGDRKWHMRYRDARAYADKQAEAYWNGDTVDTHQGLTGAAWVAEAYTLAAEDAHSLMQVEGAIWQPVVDECKRLAQEYREEAAQKN